MPISEAFGEQQATATMTTDVRVAGIEDDDEQLTDLKPQVLNAEAKAATDAEHALSLGEAINKFPKAMAWSVLLSTAIAMEGYDSVLVNQFLAFPSFVERYGTIGADGKPAISAAWQAGLSNGARVGEIMGLALNGWIAEIFGFKRTMLGTLVLLTFLIFIPFFAQNIATLQAAQVLLGIPWGVFQTLTTAYAAEVCPVALRAYLTSYVNMMWGLGQLIASGVLRGFLSRTDQWAYRIPFALQWLWPVPLIIGISFAPESPWWLVRQNRNDDARKALARLSSAATEAELDHTVSMMIHTNEMEKQVSVGTTYLDCFRGVNLRRTEITCIAWLIQSASGASLMGYAAYFFEQAGLSTDVSFDFSISLYALSMIGVLLSWFAMTYLGRRTIYLTGLIGQFAMLMGIGFASLASSATNTAPSYAIGSLLLVYTLIYDIGVGTVAYSMVAETPSTRLRTKTIVLARNLYNVQGIINGVITPYMLNETAWNWKAKAGFFWAGTSFLCLVWTFFRLPEPKGRTYGELDVLFENGVSARKFKTTVVDPFAVDGSQALDVAVVGEEKTQVAVQTADAPRS
ncbi:sugar transporter [Penicillium riverlandense]|uniref:sugar transporter n=1 Tax=Penicillium riverlandense TaxID=1903569 RepID=UPI002546CF23|nr:sugar transporter [Penicillium riverlandense]KAJ5825998.1 sugar transporter [Penicillium riverlandense]